MRKEYNKLHERYTEVSILFKHKHHPYEHSDDHSQESTLCQNQLIVLVVNFYFCFFQLFKTHMDYMERTKILMGGDKITDQTVSGSRKYDSFYCEIILFLSRR